MSAWESRIVGYGKEAPDQLLANPRNWRIHPKEQQDAVEAALGQVGWVKHVIVNKTTGHVVDGHLRVGLALRRGEQEVPVAYVELTEDEERAVIATLDPLAALAESDDEAYEALLGELNAPSEGNGQGLADGDLRAALDELSRAQEELEKPPADRKPKTEDGVMAICPYCAHEWPIDPDEYRESPRGDKEDSEDSDE